VKLLQILLVSLRCKCLVKTALFVSKLTAEPLRVHPRINGTAPLTETLLRYNSLDRVVDFAVDHPCELVELLALFDSLIRRFLESLLHGLEHGVIHFLYLFDLLI